MISNYLGVLKVKKMCWILIVTFAGILANTELDEPDRLMMNFYRDPTQENLHRLRLNDDLYYRIIGDRYNLYLTAIYNKWGLGSASNNEAYQLQVNSLLGIPRIFDENNLNIEEFISPHDLDDLWILFYATGDLKYPNRIKDIYELKQGDYFVQRAARGSYQSHIDQGFIQ